jgi:hypothetical protein
MKMRDREVKYFETKGYDFPSHQVVVIKTINGFIVAIPFLKWSYNVGSWSSDSRYWESKLTEVLEVQDYHYEIEPIAEGLAKIDPEPQTLKEFIESDPERHEDYKRFCRDKFGSYTVDRLHQIFYPSLRNLPLFMEFQH